MLIEINLLRSFCLLDKIFFPLSSYRVSVLVLQSQPRLYASQKCS